MANKTPQELIGVEENEKGVFPNGQFAQIMRKSIENKNLLADKGSIYVGTGEVNSTTIDNITYETAQTEALNLPEGSVSRPVLGVDNTASGGIAWQDLYSVTGAIVANDGIAIGEGATAKYSNAIAYGISASSYTDGVAIGANSEAAAQATAIGTEAAARAKNSIQIGQGTNIIENTLQVFDYTLMNSEGTIPFERIQPFLGYDVIITTHSEFKALYESDTWLGATSVAFIGSFSRSDGLGLSIPSTVKRIDGFKSASITITEFVSTVNNGVAYGFGYSSSNTNEDRTINNLIINFDNLSTESIETSVIYNCKKLNNITVNVTNNGSYIVSCFKECTNSYNCASFGLEGQIVGFKLCSYLSNCISESKINENVIQFYGFHECSYINNANVTSYATSISIGYYDCTNLSNCDISNKSQSPTPSLGYSNCEVMSNCSGYSLGTKHGVTFCNCSYCTNCKQASTDSATATWSGTNSYVDTDTCPEYVSVISETISGTGAYMFTNCRGTLTVNSDFSGSLTVINCPNLVISGIAATQITNGAKFNIPMYEHNIILTAIIEDGAYSLCTASFKLNLPFKTSLKTTATEWQNTSLYELLVKYCAIGTFIAANGSIYSSSTSNDLIGIGANSASVQFTAVIPNPSYGPLYTGTNYSSTKTSNVTIIDNVIPL